MAKRIVLGLAAAIIAVAPANAQTEEGEAPPVTIPKLAATAKTVEGFAPEGWTVEAKASGDLDRNGKADIAFVLHQADPKNVLKNEGMGPDRLDTNPRILGVALAVDDGFRLVAQNATLIPRHVEPNMDDPFGEDGALSIARGAVKVEIRSFANAGGWGMSNVGFTFAVRDGTLELIGYDKNDVQRNSGEMTITSVNYASGKMSVSKGTIEDDNTKTVWSKLPTRRGPTVDRIGDGFEFDPKAKR